MSFSTVDKMLDANWISSAIIEAWDGLIYVGTADHHIQFLNERFIRQLGRDATGEHCYAALHSRIAPCPWCPKEVFEGKSTRGHFQEPANGLWFDVLNAPIPKADGTFAKVAFIQPVADHKPTSRRLPVFRNLVDNLTDSVFFHEASSGRVLYANEAACRTLGYPREELLKMHKWDYAQAFVSPADWHAMVTRIEDEGNAIVETQLRRRDGGSLTVEINAAVVQTGLQRLIVSVVRDITEHKRTEERLAEERNKVEAIMAAMGDGITVQDRNFRIIYQNDVIIRRRGHHLGTFCYQAYENRDSVCDDCQAQKSFVDGCIHSRQIVVETDEGTFHREITSSPLRDAEGNIVACVEVARDITEQQRVARELRTSIEKYRLLFSAESDAIITYDEGAGTIHEVNDAACQLYGLERDEFIGRSWLELIADAGEKTSCHLCTAVHKRSDGTLFPVEFSAGTFDWDGKTMAVAIVRDMTERMRLEKAREEVLAIVSHEMRTPLTAIRGFAEYLTENELPPEQQREFFELVISESKRLQDLIENLLNLQRLRAGIGLESPAPTPIAPLLQDVVKGFRSPLENHWIELDCADDLPPALGETDKIHLALKNLVGNAIKYSPAETKIVVGARPDGNSILLWVKDEGPGIRPEQRERIFERYYRASCDKKPVGSGMGLALVREIAEAHNGRVWVDDSPDGGSIFYLRLPLARQ